MKKVAEYVDEYTRTGQTDEDAANVLFQMVLETGDLLRARKARSNQALVAIWNEIDTKWRRFAEKVDGLNPDAFVLFIKRKFPEANSLWKSS